MPATFPSPSDVRPARRWNPVVAWGGGRGLSGRGPGLVRWSAAGLVAVAAAIALAFRPWLAAGVIFGGGLVAVTVLWPLQVVGVMLALGPLDLSFVTGGFKALFPELGGLDMNGIRLLGVSAGLALVVLTDPDKLRRTVGPMGRWYLAFLAFGGATLAVSPDPLEGLRLLVKIAYPFLFFLVVAGSRHDARALARVGDGFLIGATVLLLLNPLFVAAGGFETDLEGRLRVQGLGVHENPFSFYLLVVLLFAVARYTVREQMRYLLLAAFCAGWMALTLTRISVGAGLLGLAGLGVYGAVVHRNYRALAAAAGGVAVIALALTPVVLERTFGYVPSPDELWRLARHPVALYHTVNWQGRELFWGVLWERFVRSPWVGSGLGASTAALRASFPPEFGLVAHNEYLRLGVDTGLAGVALYFVAVASWLVGALRAGARRVPGVQEYALPAVAGILAWALVAATDNAFDYYAPFTQYMGFLVGATVLLAERASDGLDSEKP